MKRGLIEWLLQSCCSGQCKLIVDEAVCVSIACENDTCAMHPHDGANH